MDIIKSIEHEQLKASIPDLKIGNTVKVHVRIKEGNKERIQIFEGIIIKVQGSGVNKSFTVRKISYGVGVEKTFLVHSPLVEKVELVRVGNARRARLFYLRDRIGKAAKTKEIAGARIENKEIIIKSGNIEVPEEGKEEKEEDVTITEESKVEVTKTSAENSKVDTDVSAEEVKEAAVVEEVKEEAEKTVKAEEVKEEAEKTAKVEEVKVETTEEPAKKEDNETEKVKTQVEEAKVDEKKEDADA